MDILGIIDAIRSNRVLVTDHADEEAQNDRLTLDQVFSSVEDGEIIEEYPMDKPFPSCLIYGCGPEGDQIHSVWGYNRETQWTVLITVYRPDPDRWIDGKVRKP